MTFLGRKACNSEIRYFTFHISTKEMNMLVRLVHYLNFQCHFVSEVAGDFRQSSQHDFSWKKSLQFRKRMLHFSHFFQGNEYAGQSCSVSKLSVSFRE